MGIAKNMRVKLLAGVLALTSGYTNKNECRRLQPTFHEVYLDGNNNFIPSIAGTLATCKTGYNWKGPSVVWESISPSGERVTIRSKRFYDPWGDSGDSGFLYFEQLELRFFPNGLTKDYEGYRFECTAEYERRDGTSFTCTSLFPESGVVHVN